MKEELISFETAKLAKEKGFDLLSNNFYCENYEGLCNEGDEFLYVYSLKNSIYDCNNEFEEGERFYANSQALFQKWLREVHNIFISIFPIGLSLDNKNGYRFRYEIIDLKELKIIQDDKSLLGFLTYEEALEIALQKTLKII